MGRGGGGGGERENANSTKEVEELEARNNNRSLIKIIKWVNSSKLKCASHTFINNSIFSGQIKHASDKKSRVLSRFFSLIYLIIVILLTTAFAISFY